MSKIHVPNLVNPNAVDEVCELLAAGTNYHFVKLWIHSTLRRWMQAQHNVLLIPKALGSFLQPNPETAGYRLVEVDTDAPFLEHAWARNAMLRGELYEWHWPSGPDLAKYRHWIDYADTLPIRAIRHSVPDMIQAVAKWDEQLAKQVLRDSLTKGIETVWSHGDFSVVRLVSPEAHDAEGAYMRHCVGTSRYDERKHSEQYSLRGPDGLPLATIQLVDVKIVPRPPAYLDDGARTALLAKWRSSVGKCEVSKVMIQVQGKGPSKLVAKEHEHLINLWFDSTQGPHGFRPKNYFDERTHMDYSLIQDNPSNAPGRLRRTLQTEALMRRPERLHNNPFVGLNMNLDRYLEERRIRFMLNDHQDLQP